jgi:hypothetical protein
MASGKQIAEQNLQIFQAWLASKTDSDFRQMVSRGVLSRKEIANECGFAKSALDQNPRIKAALKAAENGLRERGILPALEEKPPIDDAAPPMREAGQTRAVRDAERLRRLEQEGAHACVGRLPFMPRKALDRPKRPTLMAAGVGWGLYPPRLPNGECVCDGGNAPEFVSKKPAHIG